MKTKQGEPISEFTQLRSSTYPRSTPIVCVGITDKYVIVKHKGDKGGVPWVMDQADLDRSTWVYYGQCESADL